MLQRGGDPVDKTGRLTWRRSAQGGPGEIRNFSDALDDTQTPPKSLSLHVAAMEHADSELNAQLSSLELHVRDIAS